MNVISEPIRKTATNTIYTVERRVEEEVNDTISATLKDIAMGSKSFGLSSLLDTPKSDVNPKAFNKNIESIGIMKVNRVKRSLVTNGVLVLMRTDNIAVIKSKMVTGLDINVAILFFIWLFIMYISISIPDSKNIPENISEVSKLKKYSLSILRVFMSNLINP